MTIKIPKKIKIAGMYFDVQLSHLGRDEQNLGSILTTALILKLDDAMPELKRVDILVHEILHGVLDIYGHSAISERERTVNSIASGLCAALLDSPGLLEYLIAVRDERDRSA